MSKIGISRMTGMGDVAIASIMLDCLSRQYPHDEVVFITKDTYTCIPLALPYDNLKVVGVNYLPNTKDNARKLFTSHIKDKVDMYIELNDINREVNTYLSSLCVEQDILYSSFHTIGLLTELNGGTSLHDAPICKRVLCKYLEALASVGFSVTLDFRSIYSKKPMPIIRKECKWIGVSAVASTIDKTIPPYLFLSLVEQILKSSEDSKVILFGASRIDKVWYELARRRLGARERIIIAYDHTNSIVEDLPLIANCDVMVSPDSGNGHLASLCDVPVITIWGCTHPKFGWQAYTNIANFITDIPCHPCSLAGGKNVNELYCKGRFNCFAGINIKDIVIKINQILN